MLLRSGNIRNQLIHIKFNIPYSIKFMQIVYAPCFNDAGSAAIKYTEKVIFGEITENYLTFQFYNGRVCPCIVISISNLTSILASVFFINIFQFKHLITTDTSPFVFIPLILQRSHPFSSTHDEHFFSFLTLHLCFRLDCDSDGRTCGITKWWWLLAGDSSWFLVKVANSCRRVNKISAVNSISKITNQYK